MCGPPDPEMRSPGVGRARAKSQSLNKRHQVSEEASALQEKKFRRLCQRTVSAIVGAIYRIAETEQTRKIEASLRERAEARG
jgi:hypothetical protein